jgi:uncharacterized membrane protein YgcG
MKKLWLWGVLALVGFHAQALIMDEAGLLTSQQVQALGALTADGQVAVHIVPSTGGQSLKAFSDEWARSQKAGDSSLGVVITVVPPSHQVYISISTQARDRFTNAEAGQVIRQDLVPAFRSGDYAGGLTHAVQIIQAQLGTSVATTSSTAAAPVVPMPPAVQPRAPIDWGLVALLLLVAGVVGFFVWNSWNTKFRQFESVVSAGQPDFPMVAEVKAQSEVKDALEMLEDLHSALPVDFRKRAAYYRRRKDDFRKAYETCRLAQQTWDLERQRENEAKARFEAIRSRADSLPEAERQKFLAMEAQYQASGYNTAFLLQNMLMMDMMMGAFSHPVIYQQTFIENQPGDQWQTGVDDGFDGGDSGGDGGDGGSW